MPRKDNGHGGRGEENQKTTGTGVLLRARLFFYYFRLRESNPPKTEADEFRESELRDFL